MNINDIYNFDKALDEVEMQIQELKRKKLHIRKLRTSLRNSIKALSALKERGEEENEFRIGGPAQEV